MPKKKNQYTVIGNHSVAGHEPGATFSSDMSEEQAEQLIKGGHLVAGNSHEEA